MSTKCTSRSCRPNCNYPISWISTHKTSWLGYVYQISLSFIPVEINQSIYLSIIYISFFIIDTLLSPIFNQHQLLERNPLERLADAPVIKAHPYFSGVDWEKHLTKDIPPPFIPPTMVPIHPEDREREQQRMWEGFTFVSDSSLNNQNK